MKLIESEFNAFMKQCFDEEWPRNHPRQYSDLLNAFFAGAYSVYTTVINTMKDQDLDGTMTMFKFLEDELREFVERNQFKGKVIQ